MSMEILFAGTGAADWDWSDGLNRTERGSTVTVLGDRVQIDAGPTAVASLLRAGRDPAKITELLFTHTHEDHFDLANIRMIAEAPGRTEKLRIYASSQGCCRLAGIPAEKFALRFGETLRFANGLSVKALPANHGLPDFLESAHHFLFTFPDGKNLLYALDGGWMCSRALRLLHGCHLDMIVWDATCGNTFHDFRFADHNDLEMIRAMRLSLSAMHCIDSATCHVFNHIARTLWPDSPAARQFLAKQYDGILTHDLLSLSR